jgi:hypothetical protein
MEHNMDNNEELPPDPFAEGINAEEMGEVDLTNMWLRKFSWDIIQCSEVQEMQRKIGLVPTDQESAELEHIESHTRMKMVGPLEPAIDDFAGLVSKVLSAYLIEIASEGVKSQVSDATSEKLVKQNAEILRIGTLAIVATLMDTGVIGYTERIFAQVKERAEAAEHEQEQEQDKDGQ